MIHALVPLLALLAGITFGATSPPAKSQVIATKAPPSLSFGWKRYAVKTVSGRVLAFEPWSSSWTPVLPDTELSQSTLVQLASGATCTLVMRKAGGFSNLNADSVEITLNSPSIIRLQDDMLRQVKVDSYFIPRLPDVLAGEKNALKKNQLFKDMHEAWDRFAAVLIAKSGKDMMSFMGLTPGNEKPEAEVAVHAKKLRILSPRDGAILVTERLPAEVKIAWREVPELAAKYEMRIWRQEAVRPAEPTVVTNLNYHVEHIYKEGNYLVQVTTKDGRWQSSAHRLHIAYPFSERIAQLAGGDKLPRPPLPLAEPPDGFVYVARQLPVFVSFRWEKGNSPTDHYDAYELVLKSTDGKELFRRRTRGLTTQLKFAKAGDFRWHVDAIGTDGDGRPERVSSDPRSLRVQDMTTLLGHAMLPTDNPFDQLFVAAKSGVFYIEEGL